MKLVDLLSLVIENLKRRKGRVALTAVGVVIGTAAVVILVSLGNGLQRNASTQLGSIGDLTQIMVMPRYDMGSGMVMRAGGGGGGGGGETAAQPSQQKLLTNAAIDEIKAIPGVKLIIPRESFRGPAVMHYGRLENYAQLTGMAVDDVSVLSYQLDKGSSELKRGTAIVGGWVLKNFMDPKMRPGQEPPAPPDLLGQQISIVITRYTQDGQQENKTVRFTVTGLLAENRSEADSMVIISMDDMTPLNEWMMGKRINRNRDGYDTLLVKTDSSDQIVDITQQINDMQYQAYTPQQFVQGINSFFVVMQIVFGGVGAIALLVAAIGIANTMTMAILERTREIGLMKAVGATNRDVLSIFLGEAAGIGFIGGLMGVLLGWLGGTVIDVIAISVLTAQAAENGGTPPTVAVYTPLWLPVFALVFATLIGLISGLYPALRAASLVPVIALKYE
ncbi:MAG: ABC transporter permease [Anaerolineae bacterium]|nr:ABC transporter permease [Anaerolineae bacterium]